MASRLPSNYEGLLREVRGYRETNEYLVNKCSRLQSALAAICDFILDHSQETKEMSDELHAIYTCIQEIFRNELEVMKKRREMLDKKGD